MRSYISLLTSLLIMSVFVSSCQKGNDIIPDDDTQTVSVEDIQQVADANRAFGLELFQKVAKEEADKPNVLISPLSIHTAMNMAVNGAAGETKTQMLDAMHSSDWSIDELNEQQADWRIFLKEQSGHPTLLEANAFFKDPNRIRTNEGYENALREYYAAGLEDLDFSNETAKDQINSWVEDNTNGKIDKIVEDIGPLDLGFLINTIYYKANWSRGFDEDLTRDGKFITGRGDSVDVSYVNADRNFTFTQSDAFMAVDLPFEDSTYSLTLLRPQNNVAFFRDWIQGLTVEFFDNLYENMEYSRAQVFFPKMKLAYKKKLNDALVEQGMTNAFNSDLANFEEMGQALIGPTIFISRVNHKSVLEIDEKGAEGAAVTSVGFSTTSLPPTLEFDRSFLVVLRHIETNSLVFIGSVTDPTFEE